MENSLDEIVSALRRAKITRRLSEAERMELAADVHCRRWPPKSGTFWSRGLLLVVHGYVDVVASSASGRDLREAHFGAGTLLHPRAEAEWGPNFCVRAGEKGAVVGAIPLKSLAAAARGNPQALLEMLTWQNDDVDRAERLAALKALYSLRGQVALRLVEEALSDSARLVRTTHVQLALDLGCSRSRLTMILNDFRVLEQIEYQWHDAHRDLIAVTNPDGLLREAGE